MITPVSSPKQHLHIHNPNIHRIFGRIEGSQTGIIWLRQYRLFHFKRWEIEFYRFLFKNQHIKCKVMYLVKRRGGEQKNQFAVLICDNQFKFNSSKSYLITWKNKYKSCFLNFENVNFEKIMLLFHLFFGVKQRLQFYLVL